MIRWILLALLVLGINTAQAKYEALLNKSYASRYTAIDSIFYDNLVRKMDSSTLFRELDGISALAHRHNDFALEMECKMIHASYFLYGEYKDYPLFEQQMQQLQSIADKRDIKQLRVRIRVMLGYYYFNVAQRYNDAFNVFLAAYDLMKDLSVEEFPTKGLCISDIGADYYHFGDYSNARKYLREASQLPVVNRANYIISPFNTLGLIDREEHQYDSAEYHFMKAYSLAATYRDSLWMAISKGNLGTTYFLEKKYAAAIPLLEKDVQVSSRFGEIDNALASLIRLIEIRLIHHEWQLADSEIAEARSYIPQSKDSFKHLDKLYPLMAKRYAANNDMQTAYRYADSALVVRDTVRDRMNALALTRAEQKVMYEQYNFKLSQAGKDKKQQQTIRNTLIGCILLVIIIAVLLINRTRLKTEKQQHRKMSEQLDHTVKERTASLHLALKQQELLVREIHHRVKNNLQVIYSLQQMQSARSDDEHVKNALTESQNRILSIAFIHQNLYSNNLEGVEISRFVNELVGHINAVYDSHKGNISIHRNIESISLDIDTAVPLGLIINELLTNSYKHAFPESESGNISINLSMTGPGNYCLRYEDDGPGLPSGRNFESKGTMGLMLIGQLAEQLMGELIYEGKEGFHLVLRFKDVVARSMGD